MTDGTGAIASIVEGGVNQNHTKILLKSQPGGRINNKITIFAYRHPVAPHQQTPSIGWRAPPMSPPAHPNGMHQPQATPHKSNFPWPHFHKKK